jgi:hypothetical protein
MRTFPFPAGMDWGKLGFTLYSNSLSYRNVLEQNPQWSVTELPPIGAILKVDDAVESGRLQGSPLSFGLASELTLNTVYPFDNATEFLNSLARYSPASLSDVEAVNGLTMVSTPAITGLQG